MGFLALGHQTVQCTLCQVGPSWPRGRVSHEETRERQVPDWNFSGAPDSAPDCTVCTGQSGAPVRRRLLVTASWWVRAIYTPSTHHIQCLASHIKSCTLKEHSKHQKPSEEIRES
jgi:hypothetical protein